MEHSIGTGLIVGIVTASSLYVWNSESFTKPQKTALLICAILPPAQWVGILVVLVYNYFIESNSVEKITERKVEQKTNNLNTQIENIRDLKNKGILTEEEFKSKVEKIEAEKTEQKLKSSTEYKQLKSLLDSGILSKEEFGKKVVLLYNSEVILKDKPFVQKFPKIIQVSFTTDKGKIEIELSNPHNTPEPGKKAFKNGEKAPDGKYKFGFMWFVHIKEGIVTEISLF